MSEKQLHRVRLEIALYIIDSIVDSKIKFLTLRSLILGDRVVDYVLRKRYGVLIE